jgi:hypothetical protein
MHVYVPATPAVGRRKRIHQAGVFMGAGVVSIAWLPGRPLTGLRSGHPTGTT